MPFQVDLILDETSLEKFKKKRPQADVLYSKGWLELLLDASNIFTGTRINLDQHAFVNETGHLQGVA